MTEVDSKTSTTVREMPPIKIDSQAQTVQQHISPYISSEQLRNESGQPSATWFIFPFSPTSRLYAHSEQAGQIPGIDPELELEFQAWDMLSDESFNSFEQNLD